MTRALLALAVALAVAWSSPASAGWLIEQTARGEGEAGRQRILIQANRLKTVVLGAAGTPASAVILDLDADTITHVDYAQRTYVTATSDEYARAMTASVAAATEQLAAMRDALKDLPPEQRRMMEQMLGAQAPTAGGAACQPPRVEFRRAGPGATIAGYPTVRYGVLVDGKPDADLWLAPGIAAWRELDGRKLERMMGALARGACGRGTRGDDLGWRIGAEGYPVRTVPRSGGAVEVTRAQSQPLAATEFQPPPGFARTSMDQMLGR